MSSHLSVIIITKNEARNIEDCLKSVGWAHERIVVDQFSEDGTFSMAKQLGAKVFQEPWKGFSGQKNSALEKALGPWILSLDADERVTHSLRNEIQQTIGSESSFSAFCIPRKNFFCGRWIRHGGWYPDYNLRLFKKGTGRFEQRAVHEKVVADGPVGYLKNPMEHYTDASVSDYLRKMERYSKLAAREITGKARWSRWHNLTLRPFFEFLNTYVLRGGFLDGARGFFLAVSSAYSNFLKYYRYYENDLGDSESPPTGQDHTDQGDR